MGKPQAKLISHKVTESAKDGRLYHNYIFECVDCGEQYSRSSFSTKTNPYCASCSRKYTKIQNAAAIKRRQIQRDLDLINRVSQEIHSAMHTSRYTGTRSITEDALDFVLDEIKAEIRGKRE